MLNTLEFRNRVKEHMEQNNLSGNQFAKLCGIPQCTLSNVLRGAYRTITRRTYEKIRIGLSRDHRDLQNDIFIRKRYTKNELVLAGIDAKRAELTAAYNAKMKELDKLEKKLLYVK